MNPLAGLGTKIVFNPQGESEGSVYVVDSTAKLAIKLAWTNPTLTDNLEVSWDGKDAYLDILGDGVYLYRVVGKSGKMLGKGKILVINQ